MRVLRRWSGVREPEAYLRRAVVNATRSHLRRRMVERRHVPDPPQPVGEPELDVMWQHLQRVTPRRRIALVLRYYEDLPLQQVALAMGVTVGTAKSLVSRGLNQLEEVLRDA